MHFKMESAVLGLITGECPAQNGIPFTLWRKPSWKGLFLLVTQQLLLGHPKMESTVCYYSVEVDDALEIGERIDF